jgi:cytochrome oxidase Cu insertion factor (SCO1/SenC/PrrC family)
MRRILLVSGLVVALLLSLAAKDTRPAPPEPRFKVGDMAPDFTLKDQNGREVSLHDFRGHKNVALAFYIFAFTGG